MGAGLTVVFGYGEPESDPATHASWKWTAATYQEDADGLTPGDKANDRYTATLQVPVGTWDVVMGARVGTGSLVLIDRDGTSNGYQPAQAMKVTVIEPKVDWCKLLGPASASGQLGRMQPVNVTAQVGVPASGGNLNDKSWLAADSWPGSPFRDRLYLVWSQLNSGSTSRCTLSTDQGQTWSPLLTLGPTGSAFKWPVHVAVAPNGDVYAAEHRQPNFSGASPPSGTSGRIHFYLSADGGATFAQQNNAAAAGDADFSFNYQFWSSGKIPGSATWVTSGSCS